MITLENLVAELGPELRPAPGTTAPSVQLTGVHVSELEDPTPYLEGGELLLTTGMPLSADAGGVAAYVERLASRGVAALGLGLGPWGHQIPAEVAAACAAAGLALVQVPDGVPFQNVSRAFWRLSSRDDAAGLRDFLGTQTALARAAARPDAITAVIRGLAQALGGWAAYLPAPGAGASAVPTVWPPSSLPALPSLEADLQRLNRNGSPAAATFEVHGQPVVAHPIMGSGRARGFLVVGSGRTLTGPDRQVISTVCTLLALRVRQREIVSDATSTLGGAVVLLLQNGHTEAARLVADEVGLGPLPERVRWLALRTPNGHDDVEVAALARRLAHGPGFIPELSGALRRQEQPGDPTLFLTAASDWLAPTAARTEEDPGTGEALAAAPAPIPEAAPAWAGGALGEPQALSDGVPAALLAAARGAAPGELSGASERGDLQAQEWVKALREYARADLLGTVTEYLRQRGHWEDVSRALGVHRNTVRHRMDVATELLGANLDDPDVAAHLWLALRQAG